MLSGRDALNSIDRAIAEIRGDQEKMSARIREATDSVARMRTLEAEEFRKLAEVRLDAIRRGELDTRLSASEARAGELIAGHAGELDRIEKDIARGEAERGRLMEARETAADAVADAQKAFDAELAKFQAGFRKTDAFKAAFATAEEAEKVVAEAERKAQLAADDRTQKGAPYEADQLFMYLWERKFGTADYASRGIIRMLDRWVARIARYMDNAANYRMLLEIPRRLAEHVAAKRTALDAARDNLRKLEEDARGKDGVGKLETALEKARADLADLDAKIAAESERRNALETERGRLVRGEDGAFQKAIGVLTSELSRQDLRALHREALLTATREDEAIVERIDDLRDDLDDIERELSRHREGLASLDRRRADLESVRQRYVGSRYDDTGSYFENDDLLKDLLIGVLRGVLSGGGMWREIERQHRRRQQANPDFGWRRFPSPGRSSGGGIFGGGSRRGGSGGGGFRTGGGSRSGGFRTGGGF